MSGSVDIKVRPVKLAYLVEPKNKEQVEEAIRLSSTLWGGVHFPIIPLYKRMPKTWKDPVKAPEAKKVILGYIDAFDPDILVQFSENVPDFIANLGLEVIKPADVWHGLARVGRLPRRSLSQILRGKLQTCDFQLGSARGRLAGWKKRACETREK